MIAVVMGAALTYATGVAAVVAAIIVAACVLVRSPRS